MNAKKIGKEGNALTILVNGTHVQFVNAIRRTVMSSVPSLSVENVSIYRNDSVLFDEFLGSRLGSLPLKAGAKLKKGDKAKLVLHEKGPKTVYAGNIKSKTAGVDVVAKDTPITKLKEGQELKLEMEAVMGTGSENVKWQPAIVFYKELPEIKGKAAKVKNAQKVVDNCPKKVLEVKAGKVALKDPYGCTLCGYCEEISDGQLELEPSQSAFVLTIETFGQRKACDILEEASDLLKQKTADFQAEASKKLK